MQIFAPMSTTDTIWAFAASYVMCIFFDVVATKIVGSRRTQETQLTHPLPVALPH